MTYVVVTSEFSMLEIGVAIKYLVNSKYLKNLPHAFLSSYYFFPKIFYNKIFGYSPKGSLITKVSEFNLYITFANKYPSRLFFQQASPITKFMTQVGYVI